jgi:predicted flap endonuclease-1-like 5' DNA nuclease
MLIRWRGFGVRVVDQYRWGPENDYVTDVPDAEMVQELLTSPLPDRFEVAADEPMLHQIKGIGAQHAAELSLCGIATVKQLGELDEERIKKVAASIHGSVREVRAWVKAARGRTVTIED